MEISRVNSRPSVKGPSDWFTGSDSKRAIPHVLLEPQSPSSRVQEPHGIRIP